ncbi:MAG: hypothetical protein ISQ85_00575 [Planktomarina sp.]|nr:hypothetical protein [Planktomarina sp.]
MPAIYADFGITCFKLKFGYNDWFIKVWMWIFCPVAKVASRITFVVNKVRVTHISCLPAT